MSEDIRTLEQEIQSDERELARLSALEAELLDHIVRRDYTAASQRKELLSEMEMIENRLHKNRKRFASQGH